MFSNIYKNKTVLVTGHTGFKGSWLTVWLLKLGAKVIGFSKDMPTNPSMFLELGLEKHIKHIIGDIRDQNILTELIKQEKPQFVFHMAAQAIVSKSYSDLSTLQAMEYPRTIPSLAKWGQRRRYGPMACDIPSIFRSTAMALCTSPISGRIRSRK